jgi:hypothetical protein
MPHTVLYRPILIDELITPQRLNSYVGLFPQASDAELVGAYLWNAAVGGALFPLIQMAEVSLRNAVDSALSTPLTPGGSPNRFWWKGGRLGYSGYVAQAPDPPIVLKIRQNFQNAHGGVVAEKKMRYQIQGWITPTHHEIVAKTDFSTWEYIFDGLFMGPGLFWPTHLGHVFRGPWANQTPTQLLHHVVGLVRAVRQFRNRMSHHEPLWKAANVSTEQGAVAYVQGKLQQVLSLIELVFPENLKLLKRTMLLGHAERLCSLAELDRFKLKALRHSLKTQAKLERLVAECHKQNQTMWVKMYRNSGRSFFIVPAL